jgi:hypothetical protein
MDLYDGTLDMNQCATGDSREFEVEKVVSEKEESKYTHYKELCPDEVQSNKLCEFKPLIMESLVGGVPMREACSRT